MNRISIPTSTHSTLIALVLLLTTFVNSAASQQQVPDTPVGKRMKQLIRCLSEKNKVKRDKDVISIFSDEEDPAELREVAAAMHDETGGLVVKEILRADDYDMLTVCQGKSGVLLRLRITVSKEGAHRITDAGVSPHASEKKLEKVGDLVPVKRADGTTLPASRGVWQAKGYGYLIEITEDAVNYYDCTGTFGWKAPPEDDDMDIYFVAGVTKDTARITTHPKEFGFRSTRLKELPAACRATVDWTPTRVFDAFADVMTTHYPFFEVRKIDWQAKIRQHRPKVNDKMSETELFDVMEAMLVDLGDRHTGLRADIDGEERVAKTGNPATFLRLKEAHQHETPPPNGRMIVGPFLRNLKGNVLDQVLDGKGTKCCHNQIVWGRVDDNIGYINIYGMGGYALGDTDRKVAALHKGLDEILTELSDAQALIVDITTNFGGSDLYSLEIAAHFADEKRIGFSKWPAAVEEYRTDRYVTPYCDTNPDGVMYLKPVYLVTSDLTVSAAEIFTMCMRAMPHVKTVGQATSGALSDVLDKTLPNGWAFHTSNEKYVDHEGVCYEGPGIPPAIEIDIFDPDDVTKVVHDKTITKVVQIARKETKR